MPKSKWQEVKRRLQREAGFVVAIERGTGSLLSYPLKGKELNRGIQAIGNGAGPGPGSAVGPGSGGAMNRGWGSEVS